MSRLTQAISDELLNLCQAGLKRQGIRGENERRLQAIISAKTHGISQVANIYIIVIPIDNYRIQRLDR